MSKLSIAVIANCQFQTYAEALSIFLPNTNVQGFHVDNAIRNNIDLDVYDYIFIQRFGEKRSFFSEQKIANKGNVIFIPYILFSGYHPDYLATITANGNIIPSPLNTTACHSKIVALSHASGLTEEECFSLFDPEFYNIRRYGNVFSVSAENLISQLNDHDLDGNYLVNKWIKNDVFVFTPNHPKHYVIIDIARELAKKIPDQFINRKNIANYLQDHLAKGPILPVYPGLTDSYSSGELLFKRANKMEGNLLINLKEFIRESYLLYQASGSSQLGLKENLIEGFKKHVEKHTTMSQRELFHHPYRGLANHKYWARSISRLEVAEVDPVVGFSIQINSATKVATAGSCFAQHIANTLARSGMNYYVSEPGPSELTKEERHSRGYGLFSARYGNIYTAKQLLQLFERAYGNYTPNEDHWLSKDGTYIDSFRPNIGEKFASLEKLKKDRADHYSAVRAMFEQCDVFVFTLGLTEAWTNVLDGAVYPISPGVISENQDMGHYRFVNFEYDEILEDLMEFVQVFRAVNPSVQIILTVSPVPLIATYEDRHVLTSTTYSKSVLRTVAETISSCFNFIEYFPSYEIITGNFNNGSYYAKDLREVLPVGVAHVMRLFMKHCTSEQPRKIIAKQSIQKSAKDKEFALEVIAEIQELSEAVCDEELLVE